MRPRGRADYRYWFGLLFLLPVEIAAISTWCSIMITRSGSIVWLTLAGLLLVSLLVAALWVRVVPLAVSVALAIIAWSSLIWAVCYSR